MGTDTKDKRILVLGANGFVGHNLIESLSESSRYELVTPTSRDLNALDESQVNKELSSCRYDVVLNCLDRSGVADASYAEQRLRMYHNLASRSDLYGKMIYFGTGAEYGRQLPLSKVTEDDYGRCIPLDSYGFAMYQMADHALRSDNIFNLRLFGIFGPGEDWKQRFISNAIVKALLELPITIRQDRIMDYLDVADLATPVMWAIDNDPAHHAYNATSGISYRLSELAESVLMQTGSRSKIIICNEGLAQNEYTSSNERLRSECPQFAVRAMADSIDALVLYYDKMLRALSKEEIGATKEALLY